MYLAQKNSFQHSSSGSEYRGKGVGENLYASWSSDPNATAQKTTSWPMVFYEKNDPW